MFGKYSLNKLIKPKP